MLKKIQLTNLYSISVRHSYYETKLKDKKVKDKYYAQCEK